jgi:hypothetical protein
MYPENNRLIRDNPMRAHLALEPIQIIVIASVFRLDYA